MKKSLLILSLCFTVYGAFSNTNPSQRGYIAAKILDKCSDHNIAQAFSIDLGNGYLLNGSVIKTTDYNYIYTATLTHAGDLVGTVTGSFQTQLVNGVESMIESSQIETYSNSDAEGVIKTKHDTVKTAIGNAR